MPIKSEGLICFENPIQIRRSECYALELSEFDKADSDSLLRVDHNSLYNINRTSNNDKYSKKYYH